MSKKKHNPPPGIPHAIQVTDALDLHGFFPEQIPEMITAFIENARSLQLTELRIIHGKGRSRLKFEVHQALKSHPDVVSFHDAPPESGGWGVTLVHLNARRVNSNVYDSPDTGP